MLTDNHGRPINYLRLAVTDRCNLRCFYCMPAEGIEYMPKKALLSYEEMVRLVELLVGMGITKVRLTGGEPFLRKDLMFFLEQLSHIKGLQEISITTNGILTAPYIPALKDLGIHAVNLSLDTLDKERFKMITRRDELDAVLNTFELLLKHEIPTKINMVVMDGKNTEDIIPMTELTRQNPVSLRFIEEMPFNGTGQHTQKIRWNFQTIFKTLKNYYPQISKIQDSPSATAMNYSIPNHLGNVGIIAAFSRTFCGTCNRIRITSEGKLKTCLYDNNALNIKEQMRAGNTDEELQFLIENTLQHRAKDGFEAEMKRLNHYPVRESMATIGG
jgi:molybdenum cofactor biosynthesis protein A